MLAANPQHFDPTNERRSSLFQLNVRLENRLFDSLQSVAEAASGDVQCLRQSLEKIVLTEEVFKSEQQLILQDIKSWFEVEEMVASPTFWLKQREMRAYLEQRVDESVAALCPYLPPLAIDRTMELAVYLLPGFVLCYGRAEGVQLFALRANAEPAEALLFLIHVYYHEISCLFYTETSRRAAENPKTVELFRHWLLLLIQNEGLANYAILKSLLDLRSWSEAFVYFKYASLVHDTEATIKALTVCRKIMAQLNDDNFHYLRSQISNILKNPRLPVINLVGIHLAEAIAAAFGEHVLLAAADREPQEFFRLYSETGDPLCQGGWRGKTHFWSTKIKSNALSTGLR